MMLSLWREWTLQQRQWRAIVNSSLFFFMIIFFFPLTFPANMVLLRQLVPGVIWIGCLFSFLLGSERLFQNEEADGVIEQWLVTPNPMHHAIRAKLSVHWVVTIIPILMFCPLYVLLFAMSMHEMLVLSISLLVGTPTLIALTALSTAFSSGVQQKGVLMGLILLPLTLPVMILGSGTLTAAMQGLPVSGELALLLAMSLISGWALPIAITAVLRVSAVD